MAKITAVVIFIFEMLFNYYFISHRSIYLYLLLIFYFIFGSELFALH
jgi:hypothetical protein